MGHKRLDEELGQQAGDVLDLLLLASSLSNPSLGLGPSLVQGQQTTLSSTLDELVRLCDKLGTGVKKPRVCDLSLVQHIIHISVLGESQRCQPGRSVVLGRGRERAGLDDGGASEVVVEDGLAIGLENRLGGHGGMCLKGRLR
jgi:hypothetical protein